MANEKHLAILKQGVEVWNEWRKKNPGIEPDLSNTELRAVNLDYANLTRTDLSGADLSEAHAMLAEFGGAILVETVLCGATLTGAGFQAANLDGANLSKSNLSGADFLTADLNGVNLCGADLSVAILSLTDLHETNFSEALIAGTYFADVDLSFALGLEKTEHQGPSTIGIDTIYNSRGNIPEIFLLGCGVPDTMIPYITSLMGTPIQFYSAFISYSSKDQEFVERLHADLRSKGVRVWFAPEDVRGGEKLHEQIDRAIRVYDKLLLVLSENSLQSEWVMTEVRKARKSELKQKRRKLFPIRLVNLEVIKEWECFDADSGKDMAIEVREYFIPDFSNWKNHDHYQAGLARLLRDLQAEEV